MDAGVIHIRTNALRRLKTNAAKRSLPITPELERLGFRELAALRKSDGSKQMFPGLFTRKSDFATVFQKMWMPVLDVALPNARSDKKTLHSTRKTGNSPMLKPEIKDNTRLYILGHAKSDVNGRHYLEPPSVAEMLGALRHIPVVTTGLARHPQQQNDALFPHRQCESNADAALIWAASFHLTDQTGPGFGSPPRRSIPDGEQFRRGNAPNDKPVISP